MKGKVTIVVYKRLFNLLLSPFFFAFLVAISIILFIPRQSKYKIVLTKTGITDKSNSIVIYADVNDDNSCEKVNLFHNNIGNAALKIQGNNEGLSTWVDYSGVYLKDDFFTGDFNHNNFPEVYFISVKQDSVFCNSLEFNGKGYAKDVRFITRVKLIDGKMDVQFACPVFFDLQNDGFDDLFLSVNAGYSLKPRQLFVIDLHRDTILKGPELGICSSYFPFRKDKNSPPIILASSFSTNNYPDTTTVLCHDNHSWLFALDKNLGFLFTPLPFSGHKSDVQTKPLLINDSLYILALYELANDHSLKATLCLADLNGNMIKEKDLPKKSVRNNFRLIQSDDYHSARESYMFDSEGYLNKIDNNLITKRIIQVSRESVNEAAVIDLDQDGKPEHILKHSDFQTYSITRADYSEIVSFHLPFDRSHLAKFSFQTTANSNGSMFVQQGEREYWFTYRSNPFYYTIYLVWIITYFLALGFIFLIRWQYTLQQSRKKATEAELAELQLALLSRHLDPHFTFNALNAVSSLIYKEDKDTAYSLFVRFSNLIRYSLDHSSSFSTTLQEEIFFLKNYLEVQQKRYLNSFHFEINISEEVDTNLVVPKMLLQQYAENAIKHGLNKKSSEGHISIDLSMKSGQLVILISDNGQGRQEAANNRDETHTGTGLATMEQIYTLFGKLTGIRIRQQILDLKNEDDTAVGTRIELTITFPKTIPSLA
ncbi:MAG: histidine kinase [Bacteroidetes bacterium]|nr:histidine kinase [Bacteroidota bacterium]